MELKHKIEKLKQDRTNLSPSSKNPLTLGGGVSINTTKNKKERGQMASPNIYNYEQI